MGIGEIVNLVVTIIGVFGGGTLLFYRQNKLGKVLENLSTDISNTKALIDEWQDLYERAEAKAEKWEAKVDALQTKIDALQDSITEHRNEKAKIRQEKEHIMNDLSETKLELEKLKPWKCEVKGCHKRIPPSPVTMHLDN